MTNNEIKNTLKDACRLVNTMDKAHATDLLKILMDAQCEKNCASFLFIDIRKTVKRLLNELIKKDHISNYLTRKHMKQIFMLMGDYKVYPVCKLCGKPIEICSDNQKHKEQLKNMAFSWDHQIPKSRGGSYDLSNLQPTHKLCNNRRGTKPLYSKHYKLKMKINLDIVFDMNGLCESENLKYRPDRFGLRKQDSWCHKQCCQRQR